MIYFLLDDAELKCEGVKIAPNRKDTGGAVEVVNKVLEVLTDGVFHDERSEDDANANNREQALSLLG
jgi:hypothetical protein